MCNSSLPASYRIFVLSTDKTKNFKNYTKWKSKQINKQ